MNLLDLFESIEKLELKPGDRILIRSKGYLSEAAMDRLVEKTREWAGKDIHVAVIDTNEIDYQIIHGETT